MIAEYGANLKGYTPKKRLQRGEDGEQGSPAVFGLFGL